MSHNGDSEPLFQLSSGGLIGVVMQRLGTPDFNDLSMRLQLLIAVGFMWLPLAVLTLLSGTFIGEQSAQPFITDVVPQVRFLIALPLLLYADMLINPAVAHAIEEFGSTGVVPDSERTRFKTALAKLIRGRDSLWPDVIMLLLAFGTTWLLLPGYGDVDFETASTSWMGSISHDNISLSIAGWWYLLISGPLFQFILYRWLWRFLIWAYFLFQISHIRLALHATHPDLSGGLGMLGLAQQTFSVIFVAFSAVMSSTIAHNMLAEGATFEESRLEVFVFIVICVVLIYAPLLFFSKQLYAARRLGLSEYGTLGYQLSKAFRDKWIKDDETDVGKELRDSTDASTMADYGATFDTARSMRFIPASLRNVGTTAVALAAPFLPLYLIEFSFSDLMQRIVGALI
jgi:hypothetical protein